MKIVLTGYMGSGKSTIGSMLAKKLEYNFIDLDDYIENKLQSTIPKIFENKGEIYFRKKEHEYLREILEDESSAVLATGGGTPCYSGNMQLMNELAAIVVYLKVSIPQLIQRLYQEKDHRPLIAHLDKTELPEFIGKHLFERSTYYSMATHTLICDNKSPEEIVLEIEALT